MSRIRCEEAREGGEVVIEMLPKLKKKLISNDSEFLCNGIHCLFILFPDFMFKREQS